VFARKFTFDDARRALATTPGVRFGNGRNAATNVGAFATIHRALSLYPDHFVAVAAHRIEVRRAAGKVGAL
jgi:hypothetical protein